MTYIKKIGILIALILALTVLIFIKGVVTKSNTPVKMDTNLVKKYATSTLGFTISIPSGYKVDESYRYKGLYPGREVVGVKFAIPKEISYGTNLGDDSYISVEEIPNIVECYALPFLSQKVNSITIVDSNKTYSTASSSDAAAGNRYEEIVYTIPNTNPCIAIRYFIHYAVYENYPAGSIREFDKKSLMDTFDNIRRSLVVGI